MSYTFNSAKEVEDRCDRYKEVVWYMSTEELLKKLLQAKESVKNGKAWIEMDAWLRWLAEALRLDWGFQTS